MKLLVTVDGSENSILALRELARRKWDDGDEIKIIHVVESSIPVTDMLGVNAEITRDSHTEATKKGREILDEAEKILDDDAKDWRVTSEIITAAPFHSAAEEIVNCAAREGADLIVMGSRGRSMWKSLIVGSVSLAVIQHAPCSVVIVRPKQPMSED